MESLQQPLLSIRRRWLLIAQITVLALVVALVVTATRKSDWVSNATVIVGTSQDAGSTSTDNAVLARGYVDLINSAGYQQSLRAGTRIPSDLVIRANPVAASPLINLSGRAPTPEGARAGTDAFAAAFVADIQRGYVRINDVRLAPLRDRLAAVGTDIAEAQQELATLAAAGVGGQRRAEVSGRLTQLRAERAGLSDQLQAQISPSGNPNAVGLLNGAGQAAEEGPSMARNGLIGVLGGLVLGCALALFLGAREGELSSETRVRERLGLPLLAELRAGGGAAGAHRRARELDALADAVAYTRTPPVSVVVTSADRDSGKSLVARGLAAAWAEQGATVVLVEADASAPLAKAGQNGHPARRARRTTRSEADHPSASVAVDAPANLRVVGVMGAAGTRRQTSGEGLVVDAILGSGSERARFMVINAPPILRVPLDTGPDAARRDGVILVVDSVHTKAESAVTARDALQRSGATILGVVLVEPPSEGTDALRGVLRRSG
jgi:Mrp family chromosome partitioning ATPase